MAKELTRIANAIEHYVAPAFDWKHADCAVCDLRHKKAPTRPSVVHDNKQLHRIETDIATRRMLAGEEEPEAESEAFRYRERKKWQ